MPTYQYACTECGHQLEAVQSFSDAALTECPTCHGRLRKVFNSVGVVFKGSGFYRNDSRANNGEKPAAEGAPKKADSTTSSSGDSAPSTSSSSTTSSTSSSSPSSSSSSSTSSSSSSGAKAAAAS